MLQWVAHILSRISNKRASPDAHALEAMLFQLLRDDVESGGLHFPPGLLTEAGNEAANLRQVLHVEDESVLAREIGESAESLRDANADERLGRRAIAGMLAVDAACDPQSAVAMNTRRCCVGASVP